MRWSDMLKPFKKIIWTVDPFQRDEEGLRNVTRLVSEVIRCAAARHDAVVMSVHRKIGAFDLIGSVTKKVARKSPVPVLVLRG